MGVVRTLGVSEAAVERWRSSGMLGSEEEQFAVRSCSVIEAESHGHDQFTGFAALQRDGDDVVAVRAGPLD